MKRLFIALCLTIVALPVVAARPKYKTATIEGYVTGVEKGTTVYMWYPDSDRATTKAKIRNGRFTLKFNAGTGARRVELSLYAPNGGRSMTEVYAEGDKTTTVRGDGYMIGLWDVEAEFPEQAQYNVFRANTMELTRRDQELQIEASIISREMWNTMQAQGQKTLHRNNMTPYQKMMTGRIDSIGKLRREMEPAFAAEDIEVMKRTEVNNIWLEKYAEMLDNSMEGWARRWKKENVDMLHPDLLAFYSRIPAEALETRSGRKVAELYKVFSHEDAIDFSRAVQVDSLPVAEAGKPAPDVEFFDPEGNIRRLSEFRGSYVLLDFWAYWCGPCRAAMPKLRKISEKYEGELVVVSICCDTEKQWRKASAEIGITWQNFNSGTNNALWDAYNVEYIPHYVLIAPDGTVVENNIDGDIEEKIAKVINN